ncbi:MAG: tRNA uridine-5-carboxymethylaminomethyl(34) synthesis GTPase MnmE [Bacteroidaceae bacterium]|nr:tRNA uridine-5-carboxymethylaminomethyl(34) synthesis GTPase MnmE [Bacteroidaceae bacterium]
MQSTLYKAPIYDDDTICALATPAGGALGIIRLSGQHTFDIIRNICPHIKESAKTRTAILANIISAEGDIIDEAIVTLYNKPHSYTGEDCAEISCHGSSYILNKTIQLIVSQGARIAKPGEFTQRAFLNGKMDLSQAEAVADLIAASNKSTHRIALAQMRGHFSSQLSAMREQLLKLTSLIELELDFADHEELQFANRHELLQLAEQINTRITNLAQSFATGQALKDGIPVAIIGKTNVGKSTLLNRLLHDERAIVSDIHGTTRDTIEDTIDIQGITFRIIDTAGIRQTSDTIEQIGINRTFAAIDKALIVIWMLDATPTEHEIKEITSRIKQQKVITVWNKADLLTPQYNKTTADNSRTLCISAKTGQGIRELEEAIHDAASIHELTEQDTIVTSARHYEALRRAHESIGRVIKGLNTELSPSHHTPTELIAEDLRLTINNLAHITGGAITPQETLSSIFAHFCVGK